MERLLKKYPQIILLIRSLEYPFKIARKNLLHLQYLFKGLEIRLQK